MATNNVRKTGKTFVGEELSTRKARAEEPKPTVDALPKLPRLPRKPKAAVNPCQCGCGTLVARRFVPGHDAKLHAWAIRVERGLLKLTEIKHEGVRAAVAAKVAK